MSRRNKLLAFAAVGCLVIVTAVGFWVFSSNHETGAQETKASSAATQQEKTSSGAPALTIDEVDELTAKMLSPDPAVFESVWAVPVAGLPMPPSGTALTLHKETLESHDAAAHAKATLAMPGKDPSEVNVFFEYTGGEQWKIHHIQ